MSNKILQFRIATPDDAAQIQNLIQSSFRTPDPREKWTGSTQLASQLHISVDEVLAKIHKPECAVLVATTTDHPTDDGTIVASVECAKPTGTAACGTRVPAGKNNNYNTSGGGGKKDLVRLSMLAVDNTQQRTGLGRAVLARAEEFCRTEWGGVTRLGLNALSTREALIAWYERCGFERTGETSAFPRERFPALDLPEDLCFVELEKDLTRVR
ncbi:acetyltransferase [Diaporthe helianthi]|uniref:Acetyltransferase n=1 Tax=Diaporthe helianthi TaxID=158607 RepID=A0A2P5HPC8_DIAHE|nr:acetyltransferase [Diaporthe helianthi]